MTNYSEPERIEYTDSSFEYNGNQICDNFDNLSLNALNLKLKEFDKHLELDRKIEEGIQADSPRISQNQELYDNSK